MLGEQCVFPFPQKQSQWWAAAGRHAGAGRDGGAGDARSAGASM